MVYGIDTIIENSLLKLNNIPSGEEFVLKDLFSAKEWENFCSPYLRGKIGTEFYKYILNHPNLGVTTLGLTTRKIQIYKKK